MFSGMYVSDANRREHLVQQPSSTPYLVGTIAYSEAGKWAYTSTPVNTQPDGSAQA